MNNTNNSASLGHWPRVCALLSLVALFVAMDPGSALAQAVGVTYNCVGYPQTFVVPAGVTQLELKPQGAHANYPDCGNLGGYGGLVQATVKSTPGQTLYVWVGCEGGFGFGNGGPHGVTNNPGAGDGGVGGGGSAVTLDIGGTQPIVVAGGGGGGGGSAASCGVLVPDAPGEGGNGGFAPQNGQPSSSGSPGGCGGCLQGMIDGGAGQGASYISGAGAGGGGGGGLPAGAGSDNGEGGDLGTNSAGGAGGGMSFVKPDLTIFVQSGTSSLSGDGLVAIGWTQPGATAKGGKVPDADGDGVPDSIDQCPNSDLRPTVMIGNCNSGVPAGLDVDGCTINDLIARIAASTNDHSEFVRRLSSILGAKYKRHPSLLRQRDIKAILRCAS